MSPRPRKKESRWAQAFWANYLLALHAVIAIGVSCFMLYVIDGMVVNFNDETWYRRVQLHLDRRVQLQASDITTIVSATIVAIRLITGAWAARSAWRCAFILLETQGLTLRQFNRMVSWPAYFLGGSTDAYIATLVLLLLVPANLVSPVIAGAVGWKEVSRKVTTAPYQHTGPNTTNENWLAYSKVVNQSAEVFSLAATSSVGIGWQEFVGKNHSRSSRLLVTSRQRMTVKQTIDNITLPFIEIHGISWDKAYDISKDITDELDINSKVGSSLSLSGNRPFDLAFNGSAVLFDENLLDDYPTTKSNDARVRRLVPPPTIFSGTKKIAIVVTSGFGECDTLGETIFGNQTSMANLQDLYQSPRGLGSACFLIGTVDFTAGVIRQQATYIEPVVVEAVAGPSASIEGDNWVIESLYLLPDVMKKVSMLNMSSTPTWDNLDGYVEDLVRISYQATWGIVSSNYNNLPLNLTTHEFAQRLQAAVSLPRIIGWYCAQFLVLVSAALLWILQRRSSRPIAIDAGAVALLVDSSPILNTYDATEELSRMSYVTGRDGGTIQLAECDVPDSGGDARFGGYHSRSSGAAPLYWNGGPNTGVARLSRRFMLVPRGDGA